MKQSLFSLSLIFLMFVCSTVSFSEEIVQTPPEVVRALLEAIGEKNWVKTTEYLSSSFLEKHKENVLSGKYFKLSHKKDHTALYKPDTKVSNKWEENNEFAFVAVIIGEKEKSSIFDTVKLIKENGLWKVEEF